MTIVFCRVTAELSEQFVQMFPHQFDFQGLLQKVAEDSGVTVSSRDSRIQNDTAYSFQGLWPAMEKAHSLLLTFVYGDTQVNSASQGSRPFSALVEAAEAMSRGAELQEKNENEFTLIKNNSFHGFPTIHEIPVAITSMQEGHTPQEIPPVDHGTHLSYTNSNETYASFREQENKHFIGAAQELEEGTEVDSKTVSRDPVESELIDRLIIEEPVKDDQSDKIETAAKQSVTKNEPVSSSEVSGNETSKMNVEKAVPVKKRQTKVQAEHTAKSTSAQSKVRNSKKTKLSHLDTPKSVIETAAGDANLLENKDAVTQTKIHVEPEENLACEFSYCDFVAKNRKAFTDHTQRMHLSEPSQCDICKKVFQNERYMKRHRDNHEKPRHRCDQCGKMYKVLKALQHHIKTHDPDYKPPEFQCDMCDKSFCNSYILMCHKKSEHLGIKKAYLCSICGKSFTTKHTLQQHVNVHTGVRPYECGICGKSFNYESALRDHKFIHDGTKKFICKDPSCNKTFRQRSALKMHEKIHSAEKAFVCSDCGQGFTQKQALQRHIRSHKGDKSFCCKICLRAFGDPAIVRRHLIKVHKINKDVTTWREDVITKPQQKDDEKDTGTIEDDSVSQLLESVVHDTVSSASNQSNMKEQRITTQTSTSLTSENQSVIIPKTSQKPITGSVIEVINARQLSDQNHGHNMAEVARNAVDNVTKKPDTAEHIAEMNEAVAMEYPTVHVLEPNAAQSHGDVLNFDYVLAPVESTYHHLARSSEDHNSYTKSAIDRTIDEIRIAPITLADAAAAAHLIESTREMPVILPEVSTVLAGPSTHDDVLLARSLEQVRVTPEVLTAEKIMEISKQLQDVDTNLMDPQQIQTLYSYYNAVSQYFNLTQCSALVPNTDSNTDHA